MSIQVTQAAMAEILRLSRQSETAVAVTDSTTSTVTAQLDFVSGGCAEQRYQLNFQTVEPDAHVIALGASLSLCVSQAAWPHVQQLTLDYVEDLMGGSFRFDNPELPSACNCGQSFHWPQA